MTTYSEGQWAYVQTKYDPVFRLMRWDGTDWWLGTEGFAPSEVTNVRPVVILEVDDDLRGFVQVWGGPGHIRILTRRIAKSIAAQLPPEKPAIEEPQGYGAVVRLADGYLATRTFGGAFPWVFRKTGERGRWAAFDVAEVLFEGVTS